MNQEEHGVLFVGGPLDGRYQTMDHFKPIHAPVEPEINSINLWRDVEVPQPIITYEKVVYNQIPVCISGGGGTSRIFFLGVLHNESLCDALAMVFKHYAKKGILKSDSWKEQRA